MSSPSIQQSKAPPELPESEPSAPTQSAAESGVTSARSVREAAAALLEEARIADRYRVEQLLGQGGMGAVYVVFDELKQQRIALKRLRAGSNAKAAQLFEREYQTLVSLRHSAIVEAYEFGRDERGAYYTMELVEGVDLSGQAPVPWREACAYLRDVASILGLLHARKLVHRDLSPRNLLRDDKGRLKLIDFGALAPFGPITEVVGTPPFVPPEALEKSELDQRSDLFSLGALGYWLITGVNAFPARNLSDLSALWERAPAAPSSLVALITNKELPAVPHELDELLAALMRVSPNERPTHTNELIDRLTRIADLAPEAHENAVEGYLNSKVMVGRARERERVRNALNEALAGHGQALLIESDPGVGRTRFLEDAAVTARLSGMLTLQADAAKRDEPYAAAHGLCLAALASVPEAARRAVAVHAPVLGRLSDALHQRLGGAALAPRSEAPGEDRAQAQRALRDLFLTLSQYRPIALIVDDLHLLDEESRGLFVALAHALEQHPLLLVASASRDTAHDVATAVLSYRSAAMRLQLLPLTSSETLELLRSVFGATHYLERMAERLHRVTEGNPAYNIELIEHLVRTGVVHYQEGTWELPADLSADTLPGSRHAAYLARLTRLSSDARTLARALSVPHHGPFTQELCNAVSSGSPAETSARLEELVRERVLLSTSVGYRFAHVDLQNELAPELDAAEQRRVHRVLAEAVLAAASDPQIDPLRAAIHFLRAGEAKRAMPLVLASSSTFIGAELNSKLRVAAPLFEELYELLRAAYGDDPYALTEPLSVLALAGYFIDRRYAHRYGDVAVSTLSRLLKVDTMRFLGRFLGRKLALIVTLVIAGVGLRLRSKRGPRLPLAIRRLISICSALGGTAACCIDPHKVLQLASVIEPFTALGPDHAASIVHRFTRAMAMVVQDRVSATNVELRALLARLESRPVRGLDDGSRRNYIAGLLYSLGVNESWREGTEVLRIADKLEQFSPLYAMSADHLRQYHYEHQGDLAQAELMRQRVEVHAVQLGSAWQVETWAPAHATETAVRVQDGMVMKRGVQELARLSKEIPAMLPRERAARGTYLVLRGKYAEAVPVLEDGAEVLGVIGWSRTRATLAQAYNGLGQHEKALNVSLETLGVLTMDDLTYSGQNLLVQAQLALAYAGLGDIAEANNRLHSLMAQFGGCGNPVTLGIIHEAQTRVALSARDFVAAHRHLDEMCVQYRRTGIASLLQRCTSITRELDRLENPQVVMRGSPRLLDDASHLMTRVSVVLQHSAGVVLDERAKKGLQVALELSSADEAFMVLQNEHDTSEVHLGAAPAPELTAWARERLVSAHVEERTVLTDQLDSKFDDNELTLGRMRYRASTLTSFRDGRDLVVGVLVLGSDGRLPKLPDAAVLTRIADHLAGSSESASKSAASHS